VKSAALAGERTIATDANAADEAMKAPRELPFMKIPPKKGPTLPV
jgi:hypothetical protein